MIPSRSQICLLFSLVGSDAASALQTEIELLAAHDKSNTKSDQTVASVAKQVVASVKRNWTVQGRVLNAQLDFLAKIMQVHWLKGGRNGAERLASKLSGVFASAWFGDVWNLTGDLREVRTAATKLLILCWNIPADTCARSPAAEPMEPAVETQGWSHQMDSLRSMGFADDAALAALEAAEGDLQQAASRLLDLPANSSGAADGADETDLVSVERRSATGDGTRGFRKMLYERPKTEQEQQAALAARVAAAAGFSAAEIADCQEKFSQITGNLTTNSAQAFLAMLRQRRAGTAMADEVLHLTAALTETFGAEYDTLQACIRRFYHEGRHHNSVGPISAVWAEHLQNCDFGLVFCASASVDWT